MEELKLIAAQVAREAEFTDMDAAAIEKVARCIFPFEPVPHKVRIRGVEHPSLVYQCVYDWILTLDEQAGNGESKLRGLRGFVSEILPTSELNAKLDDYACRETTDRLLPAEVPETFANEFYEAVRVLALSPKSSAALARRSLQELLREKAGVRESTLDAEIQKVLDSRSLPSYFADAIDAIRVIGNFAAHPIKSKNTGEIIPVEPGEAEWLLDVIEGLFDFYFVQPIRLQARRDALNEKLRAAGKPILKTSSTA